MVNNAERLAELRRAAKTDPEAGWRLSAYERLSLDALRQRTVADDVVARELLDEAYGGSNRPYVPQRPSDVLIQERLRGELRKYRSEVERQRRPPEVDPNTGLRIVHVSRPELKSVHIRADREPQELAPTRKAIFNYEGTVAVATSDIPALARDEVFRGASPRAFGHADRASPIQVQPNVTVRQAHGHAEQVLAQRLDTRLSSLSARELDEARGKTIWIRVDQEICTICGAGLHGSGRPGVLAQLSERYPYITLEVTADDTSTVLRLRGGRATLA